MFERENANVDNPRNRSSLQIPVLFPRRIVVVPLASDGQLSVKANVSMVLIICGIHNFVAPLNDSLIPPHHLHIGLYEGNVSIPPSGSLESIVVGPIQRPGSQSGDIFLDVKFNVGVDIFSANLVGPSLVLSVYVVVVSNGVFARILAERHQTICEITWESCAHNNVEYVLHG
jgi:hypothetical protein